MNKQLQDFARAELKKGLAELEEKHIILFKRLYSHKDLTLDINTVVDNMPEDKLDWAMQQVTNTRNKKRDENE